MTRLVALALICLSLPLFAEDWPGWRGPRGDGTSVEKGIPLDFGPDKHVRWRIDVPGSGYSSPVIVGVPLALGAALLGLRAWWARRPARQPEGEGAAA